MTTHEQAQEKRILWQAALKKARAAFAELQFAERSYMAAQARCDQASNRTLPMPNKDPYEVAA